MNRLWSKFLSFLFISLVVVSCSSNKANQDGSSAEDEVYDPYRDSREETGEGLTLELNGDSDNGKAGQLRTVYFTYDSSSLSSQSKSVLDDNAKYLKSNPGVEIQIEGHCDERGGIQYNLALGERRSKAVKRYLVALGVSPSRVSTVSYGKERPVSYGHDQESWSKNRRANFVVTRK